MRQPFRILLSLCLLCPLLSAATMAGTYAGRYQCGQWNTLELRINDSGSGRISGVFNFQLQGMNPRGGTGSFSLAGQYDARTGRFRLDPQQWIGRRPMGVNMVGMEGTFDPASRRLRGKIVDFNCGAFELAPPGAALAQSPPTPPAFVPHERRRLVSNVTEWATNGFEYWDSAMSDPQGTAREAEPIDDVIDWLKKQNFSCMGTRRVFWDPSGTKGSADDMVSVRERFVIECDGDCRGVRYTPYVGAIMFHFGLTQPVPVLEIKGVWFGGSRFRWDFTRPAGTRPPPEIFVHRWTSSGFNSDGNCRAPKSNNR